MIEVTIKTLDSQNHTFSVPEDITVKQFKDRISSSVNIASDTQRLIHCGRVLQDDKKLSEYNVHEKVIHLVARAPPQSVQRSSSADARSRSRSRGVRSSFTLRNRPPMSDGHQVLFGSIVVPDDALDSLTHGPSSSGVRLQQAKAMLDQASSALDVIDSKFYPGSRVTPEDEPQATSSDDSTSQPSAADVMSRISQSEVAVIFSEIDSLHNMEPAMLRGSQMGMGPFGGSNPILAGGLAQAASALASAQSAVFTSAQTASAATVASAFSSLDGGLATSSPSSGNGNRATAQSNSSASTSQASQPSTSNENTPSTSQSNSVPSDTSNGDASQQRMRREHPPTSVMVSVLNQYRTIDRRLKRYMDRYYNIMLRDPIFTSSSSPELQMEQWLVSRVSEVMHFVSHAMHAISDIIIDLRREPPRQLRARPIIIPQPSLVQAQINVSTDTPRTSQPTSTTTTQPRPQRAASASRVGTERRGSNPVSESSGSPYPILRHFPADDGMVVMQVGPSGITINSLGSEGNGNDGGRTPDILQSLLSSITSEMNMHFGPEETVSSAASTSSQSSSNNVRTGVPGQITQAPGNSATNTTNATQTRVTPLPHVHVTPLNVPGMGISQFDPFLPCQSHHLRSRRRHNAAIQFHRRATRVPQPSQEGTSTPAESAQTNSSAETVNTPELTFQRLIDQISLSRRRAGEPDDLIIMREYLSDLPDNAALVYKLVVGMVQADQNERQRAFRNVMQQHRLPGEDLDAQIKRALLEIMPALEAHILEVVDTFGRENYHAGDTLFNFFYQRIPDFIRTLSDHEDGATFTSKLKELISNLWKDFVTLADTTFQFTHFYNFFREQIPRCIRSIPGLQSAETMAIFFRSNISDMLSIGTSSNTEQYIIRKSDNNEVSAIRKSMKSEAAGSQPELPVEEMEVEIAEAVVVEEPIADEPSVEINVGSEAWHSAVPQEWIPVITRDVARQRRGVPETNPSDGYLCGMPLKRRRIACQHKPHGSVQTVLQSTLRTSLRTAGVTAPTLDTVSESVARNLREPFAAQVRASLSENLRDNKDFTPEKFPKSDQKILKK